MLTKTEHFQKVLDGCEKMDDSPVYATPNHQNVLWIIRAESNNTHK